MFYVPYVTESFRKEYIIPYYIGETLFGVIPSFLAIVQGVGDDSVCANVTLSDNSTVLEPQPLSPAFSVSYYFRIIFLFVVMSSIAFALISCLDLDSHRHNREHQTIQAKDGAEKDDSHNKLLNGQLPHPVKETKAHATKKEQIVLFCLNFLITFFYYGVLPGIQSYSTIPYG